MQQQTLFGSTEAASKGGIARAKSLSEDDRREIARAAARSRWSKGGATGPRKAIAEAPLIIGGVEFECAVLDDETRVISERAFARAIGAKRGGSHWLRKKKNSDGANLPVFLSAANLRPFIPLDLASALSEGIPYQGRQGQWANGIHAELIPKILDVWIKAKAAGALSKPQKRFAAISDIILRGLGAVGIVSLIDEATGFEDVRAKNSLARILEAYIAKEIRQWVRTFPTSFFREICRLKNVPFHTDMKLPRYFGHIVNDLVYSRLAPGVLDELKRRNPAGESGRRKLKHTQLLTENVGHPKLLYHLGRLEGIAQDVPDGGYDQFGSGSTSDCLPICRCRSLKGSTTPAIHNWRHQPNRRQA